MTEGDAGAEFLREVTVDEFGLPSNVLGPHPEKVFQLLGRLVPVSALLENHLLYTYQTIKSAPSSEYTALGGLRLIENVGQELGRCPQSDAREVLERFIRDAKPLVRRRNLYVHSMIPAQGSGVVFAWRPNPSPGTAETITETLSIDDLQADLLSIVVLVDVHRHTAVIGAATSLRPHVKAWKPK